MAMTIERQTLVYDGPGGPFEGVAVRDAAAGATRPGVLVVPNILGAKDSDTEVAERLATLGYVALVADVYGQGKRARRGEPDVSRYMDPLNADRALLRDRLDASLAALKGLPGVDGGRCAAIGYCFGGKAVIDMARAGLGVRGVVSFHGLYDRPDYATPDRIAAKLLVCHGWDDPLAPPEALVGLGQELTAAGADWQIHAYGHAGHAFTDRAVAKTDGGFGHDEPADRRSWRAATDFLAEVLG